MNPLQGSGVSDRSPANPLRGSGVSERSRCGAVPILELAGELSAGIGRVGSLSLWCRGGRAEEGRGGRREEGGGGREQGGGSRLNVGPPFQVWQLLSCAAAMAASVSAEV